MAQRCRSIEPPRIQCRRSRQAVGNTWAQLWARNSAGLRVDRHRLPGERVENGHEAQAPHGSEGSVAYFAAAAVSSEVTLLNTVFTALTSRSSPQRSQRQLG